MIRKIPKKLMNKKFELTGKCSCNARFLRLYLKGVGGADEASSSCRKVGCDEVSEPKSCKTIAEVRSKMRGKIMVS